MTTTTITPTTPTKSEHEAERKRELEAVLTKDKTQLGSLGGTGAGIAAGAVIGSIVPGLGTAVGAVVGGAIGALAGGLGGAAIGAAIDSKEYDNYWREHYVTRPYAEGLEYERLQPAYRFGWEARGRFEPTRQWNDVEQDLGREWSKERGDDASRLPWDQARHATRDAWHHSLPVADKT